MNFRHCLFPLTAMSAKQPLRSLHIPELVDQILLALDLTSSEDIKCLWSCRSVSRCFRYFARRLTYRSIHLCEEADFLDKRKSITIERHYALRDFRKSLLLHQEIACFVKGIRFTLVLSSIETARAFSEVCLELPALEHLVLDIQDRNISSDVLDALTKGILSSGVERVDWVFPTAPSLARALRFDPQIIQQANINRLRIDGLQTVPSIQTVEAWSTDFADVLRETPTAKHLDFGWT
jgi:hypothetical protein